MAKRANKAADDAAAREHVARFVGTRYGGVVVSFRRDSIGMEGKAEFERFPGVVVSLDRYGVFTSPNGVNVFQLRFPAGKSSPTARRTAALDVMEPLASCEVEVKS